MNKKFVDLLESEIISYFKEAKEAQYYGETLEKVLKDHKKSGKITKEMKQTIENPWKGYFNDKKLTQI